MKELVYHRVEYTTSVVQANARKFCSQTWVGTLAPKHNAVSILIHYLHAFPPTINCFLSEVTGLISGMLLG